MYMNEETFYSLKKQYFGLKLINSSNKQNIDTLFREGHAQFLEVKNQARQVRYPSNPNYCPIVHMF